MKKNFNKQKHFGLHYTIDGYQCDPRRLADPKAVRASLKNLPRLIKMKPLSEPRVVRAYDNGMRDPGGHSGFVIIQESHISIHTFPKRKFVSIDIYSCAYFNPKIVKKFFGRAFGIKKFEENLVIRGKEYMKFKS